MIFCESEPRKCWQYLASKVPFGKRFHQNTAMRCFLTGDLHASFSPTVNRFSRTGNAISHGLFDCISNATSILAARRVRGVS